MIGNYGFSQPGANFAWGGSVQDAMAANGMRQQQLMQGLCQMAQSQQQQALSQMAEAEQQMGMMMPHSDGSQFSSGADALMLLRGISAVFNFMMSGGNVGLPSMSDFGGRWANDPFFNPLGAQEGRAEENSVSEKSKIENPRNTGGGAKVEPLAQSNGSSCGQTSVAMCVNSLTGKKLTDRDINSRYGFGLLNALNSESRSAGYQWNDGGNFTAKNWPSLEKRLNQEKTPVMIGLNGEFSPSGRGHIVTLLSVDGDKVTYADPANGKVKTTTKKAIEQAPPHPDGKFFFYASKK